MDVNSIVLSGEITREPIRRDAGSYAMAISSIKNNRGFGGKDKISYMTIVGFGKMADILIEHAVPGAIVCVRGTLQTYMKDEKVSTEIIIGEIFPLIPSTRTVSKPPERPAPTREPVYPDDPDLGF